MCLSFGPGEYPSYFHEFGISQFYNNASHLVLLVSSTQCIPYHVFRQQPLLNPGLLQKRRILLPRLTPPCIYNSRFHTSTAASRLSYSLLSLLPGDRNKNSQTQSRTVPLKRSPLKPTSAQKQRQTPNQQLKISNIEIAL